ncbi:DUF1850 domain-containing protein [Kiloniella sp.]|uniref:DUF1850 domain-containing protein n=1 Tax=Kiloniella sp. TaxID=1938587 RepID=UPI003A92DCC6
MLQSKLIYFRKIGFAVWLSLFFLSAPSGADNPVRNLCLYDGYSNRELVRYTLDESHKFSLSFIHSATLTPVMDIYEVRSSGIHQIAEIFETHSAGLPSFAGDVGTIKWRQQDGKFILEMDRQFTRIQLRVQREYLNSLHLGEFVITLADLKAKVLGIEMCENEGK